MCESAEGSWWLWWCLGESRTMRVRYTPQKLAISVLLKLTLKYDEPAVARRRPHRENFMHQMGPQWWPERSWPNWTFSKSQGPDLCAWMRLKPDAAAFPPSLLDTCTIETFLYVHGDDQFRFKLFYLLDEARLAYKCLNTTCVRLPLQSATPPHWAISPMAVRAIPASTRRRTPITKPDSNYVLTRCNFYSTIGMGWHKNA